MKTKIHFFRTILSGAIVWCMVFALFIVLSFVPVVKDSQLYQGIIASILIMPFSLMGALFYYKNGARGNGCFVGVLMAFTALLLDTFITVPLLILPTENGSYSGFYSDPLLWILVVENILVVTVVGRYKKASA